MTAVTLSTTEARALADTGRVLKVWPLKEQPPEGFRLWGPVINACAAFGNHPYQLEKGDVFEACCPLRPGTVVWGRETWYFGQANNDRPGQYVALIQREDKYPIFTFHPDMPVNRHYWAREYHRRSPVVMPRWATRFPSLRVGEVRCVRVAELSEADAVAAGYDDPFLPADMPFMDDWNNRFGQAAPYATAYAWAAMLSVDKGE